MYVKHQQKFYAYQKYVKWLMRFTNLTISVLHYG